MTNTQTSPIDIDRLALSQELLTIAENFAHEANLWREPNAQAECRRIAGRLADLARHVLRANANLDTADAYARAGATIYSNVVGTRRFFTSIIHLPIEQNR